MKLDAPAKINPYLSVGARRSDGLHELVSVMQAVSMFDEVRLDPADDVSIEVDPPGLVPADETNIAARAARAMTALGGGSGVAIRLVKRIPVGAGMAGGSADAAAVLWGLRELWGLGTSRKALEKVGAALGADVPFCLRGGTAAVYGAGEHLSPLPVAQPVWWVIGVPPLSLSTAEVYAEYDRLGGGEVGDPYEVADALARGDLERLGASLRNDLEQAAISLEPSIAAGRDALLEAGALAASLTGSGPAWLGLARDAGHATEVAARVGAAFGRVEVCHSVGHGPVVTG